jgi:mannan endo-1,4-beta-mannosidase
MIHFLLLVLSMPAWGKEYYASPQGNDAHPGTEEKPFASPVRARNTAVRFNRSQEDGQISINNTMTADAAAPDAARALREKAGIEAAYAQPEAVFAYLRSLGNGSYLFGQMATWVHNENPDMDHPSNWLRKVYDHTGKRPRYGCVTYDFHDDPFPDSAWNQGVKEMWDRGMLVGVFTFFANPAGGAWNDPLDIDPIFAPGDHPTKHHFYQQMDRMAANLQWLEDRGVVVVYTPFVESDDRNKWHAKEGHEQAVKLYRLVHDYFKNDKGLDHILWAYHTTANHGALEKYYPGDAYVDVLGKSAYGTGLPFSEYAWAVEKKKKAGKVIWWSELGIRGRSDSPRDCLDVVEKLEGRYPELAGFVFWSDDGHYNVIGNQNGPELMASPKIVTLE